VLWGLVLACLIGLFYAYLALCNGLKNTTQEGTALFVQIVLLNPMTALAIVLVNLLTYILAWLEAPKLETEYTRSVLWQSYVVNILLVVLMILSCFPDLFPWKDVMSTVSVPQTVMYVCNFLFTNMCVSQLTTYFNVGQRIAKPFWEYVMWPLWFKWCIPKCWGCCKCCGAHSYEMKQKHFDATYAPPEFELSGRYVNILYIITTGFLAMPGLPLAVPFTAVALWLQYQADLYWLMRKCALPKPSGFSEVLSVPHLALGLCATLALVMIWVAYFWWTRCGDRPGNIDELAREDAEIVMPWRYGNMNWAQYGYLAIAPVVSFMIWLLYMCGSPVFNRIAKSFYKEKYSINVLATDLFEAFTPLKEQGQYQEVSDDSPRVSFDSSPDPDTRRVSGLGVQMTQPSLLVSAFREPPPAVLRESTFHLGDAFFAFEDSFAQWEASQVVDISGLSPAASERHGDRF